MGGEDKKISEGNPAVFTVFDDVWAKGADDAETHVFVGLEGLRDYLAAEPAVTEDKRKAPLLARGRCEGERAKANIKLPWPVVLDVDKDSPSPPPAEAHEVLVMLGYDHVLHSTHSHGTVEGRHSYRVYLPYMAESFEELEAVTRHLFDVLGVRPTPESWKSAWFFGPAVAPGRRKEGYEFYAEVSGNPLPWRWNPGGDVEDARSGNPSKASRYPFRHDFVKSALAVIPNDERDTWFLVGMALHSTGQDKAFQLFCWWSAMNDYPKFSAEECAELWRKADADREGGATLGTVFYLARQHKWQQDRRPDISNIGLNNGDDGDPAPIRSDAGNAARFVSEHEHQLRFVENLQSWILFDGRRWGIDRGLSARRLAMDTARRRFNDVVSPGVGSSDLDIRWASASNMASKISATVLLAQAKLNISATRLDSGRLLVNVQNGTLDLRTHELRPHDPADLITKISPASYRREAGCARWDRFLVEVLPDDELRRFFQKVMGYSMQGGQEAKAFVVVYGPHDGGKSTAINACARALGTSVRSERATGDDDAAVVTRYYAESTAMETFAATKFGGGNRPELAKLMGARMVVVNEIKGELLESTVVKSWTGGDQVAATPKYAHPLAFYADGTIFFVGNELPTIEFEDDAMWERAIVLPFMNSIPEEKRIRGLIETFDLDAVLAWMVEGHRIYVEEEGLQVPDVARLRRDAHRADSDPLADFWAARVRVREMVTEPDTGHSSDAWMSRTDLYSFYTGWAEDNRLPPRDRVSQSGVTRYVNRRAQGNDTIQEKKRGGVRGWMGLSVSMVSDEEGAEELLK